MTLQNFAGPFLIETTPMSFKMFFFLNRVILQKWAPKCVAEGVKLNLQFSYFSFMFT